MREFFINSFEKLVGIIIVLMVIGVVIGAIGTMFSGQSGAFFAGLGVLFFGGIYVVMMGGILYLSLGIYHNTMRTADAIERLETKG
ncbi:MULTISPECIES: hypothetical protein [Halocynthiibacter]|uniref:Uncharacterized protein n=1 Tax=Halocynthiibacter halioticoli TaxID=2986804 RepID=A0AAE3LPC1_9RHOB|nr:MULTISPECIES: hypothetical protein [Halocynthiibacter]MCV6823197.1 hypothetical protein [Halocynthiibacter halioticoli]MCW4056198.1 hypothetical protein [Halocynthiibacter sp. SDUM655004]MDE0590836.1 hypothetical protein [Halocynthiibacter sp. C4]